MRTTEDRAAPGGRRAVRARPATALPRTASEGRPAPRRAKSRVALSAAVMTIAAGLVATLALPSYAFDPHDRGEPQVQARTVTADGEQRFKNEADAATAELLRDKFTATSSAVLLRRQYAAKFAYDGPSAQDYLKNPDHPAFSLQAVYDRALDYRGVPYVFGGADPSGFDCSGFVMYVYAQFGIALPHSVTAQDGIGTLISPEDAQPGDIVIFNDHSHDGFYAGDGKILHAPYTGEGVRVQQLWTSNVHFVRFGI